MSETCRTPGCTEPATHEIFRPWGTDHDGALSLAHGSTSRLCAGHASQVCALDSAAQVKALEACPKTGRSAAVCDDLTHAACPDLAATHRPY